MAEACRSPQRHPAQPTGQTCQRGDTLLLDLQPHIPPQRSRRANRDSGPEALRRIMFTAEHLPPQPALGSAA
jgi:hypothetical protein